MLIPQSLLGCMRAVVPGFDAEEPRDQLALAHMLWVTTIVKRQHRQHDGMATLSRESIRRIWGSDERMRRVVGSKYFVVFPGDRHERYTNGYRPSAEMRLALEMCLADCEPVDLVGSTGRVMRTLPHAISSVAGRGGRKSKWSDRMPANFTTVSIPSLLHLRRQLLEGLVGDVSGDGEVRAHVLAIDVLVRLARNTVCPGAIPIRYEEKSTGRLFASGVSLQSAPRKVRTAALAGCLDYDISNCHWSFIDQLAARQGYECSAIREYLADKMCVRTSIATTLGISVQQAKEVLLMTVYGARRSSRCSDSGDAIPSLIGRAAAKQLYQLPSYKALAEDVLAARKAILEGLHVVGGGYVNAMGLRVPKDTSPAALLAHVLQGYEAKALQAVINELGSEVVLCMHDGWVTTKAISTDHLSAVVKEAIGLDVAIEVTELPSASTDSEADSQESRTKSVESRFIKQRQQLTSDSLRSRVSIDSPAPSSPLERRPEDHVGGSLIVSGRADWNRPGGRQIVSRTAPGEKRARWAAEGSGGPPQAAADALVAQPLSVRLASPGATVGAS